MVTINPSPTLKAPASEAIPLFREQQRELYRPGKQVFTGTCWTCYLKIREDLASWWLRLSSLLLAVAARS